MFRLSLDLGRAAASPRASLVVTSGLQHFERKTTSVSTASVRTREAWARFARRLCVVSI